MAEVRVSVLMPVDTLAEPSTSCLCAFPFAWLVGATEMNLPEASYSMNLLCYYAALLTAPAITVRGTGV